MIHSVRVLQAPACEPVSLEDAKSWCKVDHSEEDDIIELLVQAARERAEDIMGRALIKRRLELRLDRFPPPGCMYSSGVYNTLGAERAIYSEVIEIPFAPLISVDYVEYRDTSGAIQRMDGSPSSWIEDNPENEPGRIQPLLGLNWPTASMSIGAVRVGYTCGYTPVGSPEDEEALRANIPALVKHWMKARVVTMFDKRDQLVVGGAVQVPRDFVDGLLDGLRVTKLFA